MLCDTKGIGFVPAAIGVTLITGVCNVLSLALPVYSFEVMGRVLPSGDLQLLASMSVILLAVVFAGAAMEHFRVNTVNRVVADWMVQLQTSFVAKISDPHEIKVFFRHLEHFRSYSTGPLGLAILDAPWSSVFLLGLFYLKVELGFMGIVLIAVTLCMGSINSIVSEISKRSAAIQSSRLASLLTSGENSSGTGRSRTQRIVSAALELLIANGQDVEGAGLGGAASHAIRVSGQALVIAATTFFIARHQMVIGSILAATMLFSRAIAPAERCSDFVSISNFAKELRYLRKVQRDLASVPVLQSKSCLKPNSGTLTFDRVSFRADGGFFGKLRDVSFETKPGQITSLTGLCGSGKSAVLAAAAGHVRPTSGNVRVGDVDMNDIDLDECDNLIGYLPSAPHELSGTILEIILARRPLDRGALEEVAMELGLSDVVDALPNKFETPFSMERGLLSRGQKQLVLLARAVYRQPRIILLDEPTVFLDAQSEDRFWRLLRKLRDAGCNILIAGRCESLARLQDGAILMQAGRAHGYFTSEAITSHLSTKGVPEHVGS